MGRDSGLLHNLGVLTVAQILSQLLNLAALVFLARTLGDRDFGLVQVGVAVAGYAMILAQASSMLAVPLIALGLFLVLNNRKVMGSYRNNLFQNIIAVAGFMVISLMVYFMYQNLLSYIRSA